MVPQAWPYPNPHPNNQAHSSSWDYIQALIVPNNIFKFLTYNYYKY